MCALRMRKISHMPQLSRPSGKRNNRDVRRSKITTTGIVMIYDDDDVDDM